MIKVAGSDGCVGAVVERKSWLPGRALKMEDPKDAKNVLQPRRSMARVLLLPIKRGDL